MNWDWKKILTTIGAACVVLLQIVNVLLSTDIETSMAKKAQLMEQKAADLQTLLERTESEVKSIGDKK